MKRHVRNTRTRYEFAIEDKNGERAYTIWMGQRNPTMRKLYKAICESVNDIKAATGADDVIWNGDGTITAGGFTGKMSGKTLLQSRGYSE